MSELIGLTSGLVLFLCLISTYILGIKHGKELTKGNIPHVNLNPIKSFKEYVETKEKKKAVDLVQEGWENINNYNPYEVKKEGE